jgi:hypothetical protein
MSTLLHRVPKNLNLTSLDMLPAMDNLLYNVQRQGKISFYVSGPIEWYISTMP